MTKLEYVSRSLSKGTHKSYETFVVNAIYSRLNNPELEIVTQQYVLTKDKKLRYIDLYFPQIDFGVEVDEPYHDTQYQKEKDLERENKIKEALLETTIIDSNKKIKIERVSITDCKDLEGVSKRIDEIVKLINDQIKSKTTNLVWEYDEEEKKASILKRGYLQRGDSFPLMADIIRIFGFNLKSNSYQRCTKKLSSNKMIWSPTLSLDGSNRDGWVNVISEDLSAIYESGVDGKGKDESNAKWDQDNQSERVVFLKYKDSLGNRRRRFLGVYVCTGYDKNRHAEIWSLKDEKCPLK